MFSSGVSSTMLSGATKALSATRTSNSRLALAAGRVFSHNSNSLSLECPAPQSVPNHRAATQHDHAAPNPSLRPQHHKYEAGMSTTSSITGLPQLPIRRTMSIQPENAVYTGPSAPNPKRVTLNTIRDKYLKGQPLSMVTAYDYPSAVHVDQAGIDMLLVGDSVGMVVHGHDTTLPVTLDDMLMHCRAVARGAKRVLLIADLPFGSYESSPQQAVQSAIRLMKEGTIDAVKLEGGGPQRVKAARAIVEAGVAVMGHVGLMPQSISVLGGFRPQGQTAEGALRVIQEALALQEAGCFGLVLECVPMAVAAALTKQLSIPTIGIGAGPMTNGQVLVYHDLLGMMQHPHHAKVTPKFCKQYAMVGQVIQEALQAYRQEVDEGAFPSTQYSPYKMKQEEIDRLHALLKENQYGCAAEQLMAVRSQQKS